MESQGARRNWFPISRSLRRWTRQSPMTPRISPVIGDEFGKSFRIHDGAGELMSADFARLFEDVDIFGGEFGLRA